MREKIGFYKMRKGEREKEVKCGRITRNAGELAGLSYNTEKNHPLRWSAIKHCLLANWHCLLANLQCVLTILHCLLANFDCVLANLHWLLAS